jgi:hypothetical protein
MAYHGGANPAACVQFLIKELILKGWGSPAHNGYSTGLKIHLNLEYERI